MPDPNPALGADGFPKSGWTPPDTGVQLAPGGEAAARAAGYAPPAAPPAPVPAAPAAPVAAAPKRIPQVRDLSGRPLTEIYDLQWPKEVDGVEIRQVVGKRLSTGEVNDFLDAVRAKGRDAKDRFPIFHRVDGALLTDDEWRALDPDDTDELSERADRFLPARFRTARASDGSSPPASATTGNSSAA